MEPIFLRKTGINNLQYRLLKIEKNKLTFSSKPYCYHDKINFGKYLVYEFAKSIEYKKRKPNYQRIASKLSNPYESIILTGISTLVLLVNNSEIRFIIGKRKESVAYAEGTFHVIPAGEFQPSSQDPKSFDNDFDLWKNIMRESAEEILGNEEFNGNLGKTFDYKEEPFISLEQGKKSGSIQVFYFGVGLDPLSFQGEILTCAVFKEDVFNRIFGLPKNENKESLIFNETNRWGQNFNENAVNSYYHKNTLATTKMILNIAWQNIDYLKESLN